MRLFSLSDAAVDFVGKSFPGNVERVGLSDLSKYLCSERDPAMVIADIVSIDNRLADGIHAAASAGVRVGIVPYDPHHSAAVDRLMKPNRPAERNTASIGLYSSRGLDFDFRTPAEDPLSANIVRLQKRSMAEGTETSPDDASRQVLHHDLNALAVVTEGRQTYCLFGMGCLHPTISDPPTGRLSPRDIRARHWLLQSCHSPFVWPELGSYLSLPLSIALTSNAETVICSTHVQTYIPDILNIYFEMISAGLPLGEVVHALNEHASAEGVDYRPFVLFGNPEAKAIACDQGPAGKIEVSKRTSSAQTASTIRLVRRLIANVEFAFDPTNFGFDAKHNAPWSAFGRDMSWLPRTEIRGLARYADSASDIGRLLASMKPSHLASTPGEATRQLSGAWEEQGGFYALGEKLDENYRATGATHTDRRCLVCKERLIERLLSYFGQSRSEEYSERSQKICPRCLVVEHVSPMHRASTELTADRTADGLTIGLTYTNCSSDPQWVHAFAFPADPNNVSKSTARRVYREMLQPVGRRTELGPVSLAPGETFRFGHTTGPIPEDFWYLLVEVNLMIDFCWNWFSFTHRARKIEKWLAGQPYLRTLPRTR
ncbi:hypothetical protein J6500_09390 [Bradyrhizobium sp. WSM 1704]|uniref:hypothetical protein n=1 Tax=Bradyrhizobium semiaridum TaxID=2821404 RepID=UPI001CE26647|nr:hypothetical protein [Bradyrhizobium semiaridum]MCA6122105.1 hypothetical protein [Bradyrhizobium semiaridum]